MLYNQIIKTSVCLSLFHLFFFTQVSIAQLDRANNTATNADVVITQIGENLTESSLILSLDTAFKLTAQFPDQQMIYLYDVLLGLNKLILKDGNAPNVHLRLFPNNSIIQLNKEQAERNLNGELHILLFNDEDILQQTEILNFSYSDIVSIDAIESLESNWNGARFHQKQLLRERNLWRQIGQPAIIAAATGVTVFLLFNVRGS